MTGWVYFITTETFDGEAVKIGYTSGDPAKRLRDLQTGCPTKLDMFGYIPGTQRDERELHDEFSSAHIRGEWFDLDDIDVFMTFLQACDWAGRYERGELV